MKVSNIRGRDHQRCCGQLVVVTVFISFFSIVLVSCGGSPKDNDNAITGSTDTTLVKIGGQVWMARNFDGVTFANGDSIPHAKSAEEWERAGKEKKPAWCYYKNDVVIGGKYGRIYNWFAINDPRGFCPKGWHVPTNDEWITLENFLGISEAGLRMKCNAGLTKTDDSKDEFCVLLGGYRGKEGGFSGIEEFTYLSSSTERDPKENDIWGRGIHEANATIMRCGLYKEHGVYVRLIKD